MTTVDLRNRYAPYNEAHMLLPRPSSGDPRYSYEGSRGRDSTFYLLAIPLHRRRALLLG